MDLSDPIHSVTTTVEGQIFRILVGSTEGFTGSRIAELIGNRSKTGVRLALSRLVEDGTVRVRSLGPSLVYSANRDHLMWPSIEYVAEAAKSARQRLQALIADKLNDPALEPEALSAITLAFFGSVARGDSSRLSDVDLLAVFPSCVSNGVAQRIVDEIVVAVDHATGNECNVYRIDESRFDELVDVGDPMIASWHAEARTFHGPDVQGRIRVRRANHP
ncbi:nucleotidyltransferase domain-containing protein [Subtercola endophyticus]|uniref:nucleotidyltransferase domain-containing protein n=1 Tax=Subtercola endophyticus TaxID=2895559 RepID=UPI001E327445|nr:nucleotidyltransferase domain-containing protein [Subtercola endophyticus]UFS57922.1 nucleotidyltransferase domain-containing protein [Subtercola endophyticus]